MLAVPLQACTSSCTVDSSCCQHARGTVAAGSGVAAVSAPEGATDTTHAAHDALQAAGRSTHAADASEQQLLASSVTRAAGSSSDADSAWADWEHAGEAANVGVVDMQADAAQSDDAVAHQSEPAAAAVADSEAQPDAGLHDAHTAGSSQDCTIHQQQACASTRDTASSGSYGPSWSELIPAAEGSDCAPPDQEQTASAFGAVRTQIVHPEPTIRPAGSDGSTTEARVAAAKALEPGHPECQMFAAPAGTEQHDAQRDVSHLAAEVAGVEDSHAEPALLHCTNSHASTEAERVIVNGASCAQGSLSSRTAAAGATVRGVDDIASQPDDSAASTHSTASAHPQQRHGERASCTSSLFAHQCSVALAATGSSNGRSVAVSIAAPEPEQVCARAERLSEALQHRNAAAPHKGEYGEREVPNTLSGRRAALARKCTMLLTTADAAATAAASEGCGPEATAAACPPAFWPSAAAAALVADALLASCRSSCNAAHATRQPDAGTAAAEVDGLPTAAPQDDGVSDTQCSGGSVNSGAHSSGASSVAIGDAVRQRTVVLYTTSIGSARNVAATTRRIDAIFDAFDISYSVVDLAVEPHLRHEMLAASGDLSMLPQLHVDGELLGGAEQVLDMHDFGELLPVLRGDTKPQAQWSKKSASASEASADDHMNSTEQPVDQAAETGSSAAALCSAVGDSSVDDEERAAMVELGHARTVGCVFAQRVFDCTGAWAVARQAFCAGVSDESALHAACAFSGLPRHGWVCQQWDGSQPAGVCIVAVISLWTHL